MDTTYYLFLMTFLLFPIIAIVVYQFIQFDNVSKFIKAVIALLLLYDILFLFGFSFKGDFADYLIFSIEYLILCFALCLKSKVTYAKVLRILARTVIIIGLVIGLIGIFIFPVITQDYKCDKTFHFISSDKAYQTRRYSFGFATLESTRYTFVTFRQYSFLPIEKKIDRTDFFDTKTNLNIDDKLSITVQIIGKAEKIIFKDNAGHIYAKLLD